MSEQRKPERPRCLTILCWNDGKLIFVSDWESNDYCEYVMVECPDCLMKYWMVNRDGQYSLLDRNDNSFENRGTER